MLHETRIREQTGLRSISASRLERLATMTRRLARLEAMLRDAATVDRLLTEGRYLRLAVALAWASEQAEQARRALSQANGHLPTPQAHLH